MFFRPFSQIRLSLILTISIMASTPCRSQIPQSLDTTHTLPSLLSGYVQYHITNRENVYAQLNKSVYLADEQIWFKIYITDAKTGTLAYQTNKVYTDLYAPDGSLHSRKVWNAQQGCVYGQIHLPDTLLGGAYTFKAYTNWQQNFEPERMFSSRIQVKSFDTYPDPDTADSSLPWDIQFFPEGGDLIAGTNARVAVKGVDQNGLGGHFSGKIVSEGTDTIASFETNELGMGSFVLPPEYSGLNNLYAIISLPQGETQKVSLPKPNTLGVSIQVDALGKDVVDIFVNTNDASLLSLSNRPFYCLVHQNGIIAEMFTIKSLDNLQTKLQVDKKQLPEGICTVTLFDHSFSPVSERLFFTEVVQALGSIELTASRTSVDSVKVQLKMTDGEGTLTPALLSASVLPATTLSGDFTSNIYAHLFLTAEVRGEVEDPAYYFTDHSIERQQALDNLLLTQAWRKYDWNTILSPNPQPSTPYPFEYGFSISGKSMRQTVLGNRSTNRSEVVLNMSTDPFTKFAQIEADGSFTFDSLLIYKPFNRINLIAMDARGETGTRFLQEVKLDTPSLNDSIRPKPSQIIAQETKEEEEVDVDDSWLEFVDPGSTLLSPAFVMAKRPTAREIMINDPFVFRDDRYLEITEENMSHYRTIYDLLQSEFGYRIISTIGEQAVVLGKRKMVSMQDVLGGDLSEEILYPPPGLIIDGIPTNWSWVEDYTIENIEAISEHIGMNIILGEDGLNGTISIKTRSGSGLGSSARTFNRFSNFKQIVVEGFDAPIAYYTPLYSNITSKINLANYSSIHWEPDVISISGESVIRFYAPPATQGVRIRIEGVGADGLLFSTDANCSIAPTTAIAILAL